jgi:hypothetical protein
MLFGGATLHAATQPFIVCISAEISIVAKLEKVSETA